MKSWFHAKAGAETRLELRDVPEPAPQPGEIIVRVKAASLNRGEFLKTIAHQTTFTATAKPAGIECAGEITRLGSGVKGFVLNERIMGRAFMAFSEFAVMREDNAMPIPVQMSWEEAACASVTYQTAYDMLWPGGRLEPGEWLLITGVSSGVGVASLQLGKLIGAKVIGTSRSEEKLNRLQSMELDLGLPYHKQGLELPVMEVTEGRGVDLIVNNVGGSVFAECLRVLAYNGRLATVGYVDGQGKAEIDLMMQHLKRLHLFGVSNKLRSTKEIAECVSGFKRDVLPAMADGRVRPLIEAVYSFEKLPQALDLMEQNNHVGKILIKL